MKKIKRGDSVRIKGGNEGKEYEVEHVIRLADNRTHMAMLKGTCHRIAISSLEKVGGKYE